MDTTRPTPAADPLLDLTQRLHALDEHAPMRELAQLALSAQACSRAQREPRWAELSLVAQERWHSRGVSLGHARRVAHDPTFTLTDTTGVLHPGGVRGQLPYLDAISRRLRSTWRAGGDLAEALRFAQEHLARIATAPLTSLEQAAGGKDAWLPAATTAVRQAATTAWHAADAVTTPEGAPGVLAITRSYRPSALPDTPAGRAFAHCPTTAAGAWTLIAFPVTLREPLFRDILAHHAIALSALKDLGPVTDTEAEHLLPAIAALVAAGVEPATALTACRPLLTPVSTPVTIAAPALLAG